jgi:hypothetical protein
MMQASTLNDWGGLRRCRDWHKPSVTGMRFARRPPIEDIPDVRDGLTRVERVILYQLHKAKAEFADRYVPTALLYGRVVEHVEIDVHEFQRVLARLGGMQQS